MSFVQSHLGLSDGSISFKSGFAGEAAKHAFVKQKVVSSSDVFLNDSYFTIL